MEFEVESVDRTGAFVGTLWLHKGSKNPEEANLSVILLQNGLAKVHEFALENNPFADTMTRAAEKARIERINVCSILLD